MDLITASRNAIDQLGAVELAARLADVTGRPVSVAAVRKWRQRGIPGKWVPAVSALTDTPPALLNPLIPGARACR